jgi:hypothetical protein
MVSAFTNSGTDFKGRMKKKIHEEIRNLKLSIDTDGLFKHIYICTLI